MTDTPETPETPETPTPAPSPTTDGTPEAKSPEDETPPAEDPPAEPTPEEAAEAARAAVHDTAEAYVVNLDDDAKTALGLVDGDPLVGHLQKLAHDGKWPQGRVDDFLTTAADMARAGLFDAGIDPAAEAAALGENAAGRRREVEVWAESLKERGEISEGEFGELMSLSPTANGVTLIEKIRKLAGAGGGIPKPQPADEAGDQKALQDKAREMRRDPRYETDKEFRGDADRAWREAWPGSR